MNDSHSRGPNQRRGPKLKWLSCNQLRSPTNKPKLVIIGPSLQTCSWVRIPFVTSTLESWCYDSNPLAEHVCCSFAASGDNCRHCWWPDHARLLSNGSRRSYSWGMTRSGMVAATVWQQPRMVGPSTVATIVATFMSLTGFMLYNCIKLYQIKYNFIISNYITYCQRH